MNFTTNGEILVINDPEILPKLPLTCAYLDILISEQKDTFDKSLYFYLCFVKKLLNNINTNNVDNDNYETIANISTSLLFNLNKI